MFVILGGLGAQRLWFDGATDDDDPVRSLVRRRLAERVSSILKRLFSMSRTHAHTERGAEILLNTTRTQKHTHSHSRYARETRRNAADSSQTTHTSGIRKEVLYIYISMYSGLFFFCFICWRTRKTERRQDTRRYSTTQCSVAD